MVRSRGFDPEYSGFDPGGSIRGFEVPKRAPGSPDPYPTPVRAPRPPKLIAAIIVFAAIAAIARASIRSPLRRTLRSRGASRTADARHSALPFPSLDPFTTLTTLPRQPRRRLTGGALCAREHVHPTDHINIVHVLTRGKSSKALHRHRAARSDPPPLARTAAPSCTPPPSVCLPCARHRTAAPSTAPTMIDMFATVPGTTASPCRRRPAATRPCCTPSPLAVRRRRALVRWRSIARHVAYVTAVCVGRHAATAATPYRV